MPLIGDGQDWMSKISKMDCKVAKLSHLTLTIKLNCDVSRMFIVSKMPDLLHSGHDTNLTTKKDLELTSAFFYDRNLYPKFASPWASSPCRPQDIGKIKGKEKY